MNTTLVNALEAQTLLRRQARMASSERLVAIRYSQAPADGRPSNCSRPRHAPSSVSCSRSSAS
jgi:hypothetical protein